MASAAEAVLLGERAGLDPARLIEVINASSGRSASTEVKFPRYVLDRSFDDGFAIGLMDKDVGIALETASELGFPAVIGSAVGRVWRAAVEEGFGAEGHTAIYAFLEELTKGGSIDEEENPAGARREPWAADAARKRGSGGASSGSREEG
jgi:3-hydroxyisobutyrate dehydrogenase